MPSLMKYVRIGRLKQKCPFRDALMKLFLCQITYLLLIWNQTVRIGRLKQNYIVPIMP